jgi:hypothetical protein
MCESATLLPSALPASSILLSGRRILRVVLAQPWFPTKARLWKEFTGFQTGVLANPLLLYALRTGTIVKVESIVL